MDAAKARQAIRQKLGSGALPKDFDLTSFAIECPPTETICVGCGEKFQSFPVDAVAHTQSGQECWFHEDCEQLWQEERLTHGTSGRA